MDTRFTTWNRWLFVLSLAGFLLVPGSAFAADSPRCAIAAAQTQSGHPRAGAELVDKIRLQLRDADACATESAAAVARITSADVQARAASDAATEVPEEGDPAALKKAWAAVGDQAEAAHELDRDNSVATETYEQAKDALATLGDADQLSTRVEEQAKSWSSLAKGSGADFLELATVAVSTAALILLVARLLLLLPTRFKRMPLHPPRALSWAPVALLADAVVACAVAWWLPRAWGNVVWPDDGALARESARQLGFLAAAVLVAVVLTWGWLFHRGRVAITMQDKGSQSTAGAAAVVGHLRSLGASPPRGLEIPLGGDAETLSAANISAPALQGVLGGLLKFLQSALSVTPWRVLVDKDSDEQTIAVISRHGRVQNTAVIRTDMFGKEGPKIDPLKLVAALALLSILDTPRSRRGLGGARDWQSVGLQYDAVTSGRKDDEQRQLLARAVDRDPESWLAKMSYRITLTRDSSDASDLGELRDWLREAARAQGKGERALEVRMRYAAYAAHLNHQAVLASEGRTCSCESPGIFAAELRKAIEGLRPRDRLFAVQVRTAAAALDKNAVSRPPTTTAMDLTPGTAFSYACFWAQSGAPDAEAKAIQLLEFAVADAEIKKSAATDPMLASLRKTPAYRRALGASPRSSLTQIAPFDVHEQALAAVGLTDPDPLSRWNVVDLAGVLGCDPTVAQSVLDRAAVIMMVPPGLSEHRLEIVDALATGMGIDTPDKLRAIRARPASRSKLRSVILLACARRGISDPDEKAFDAWLPRTAGGAATRPGGSPISSIP